MATTSRLEYQDLETAEPPAPAAVRRRSRGLRVALVVALAGSTYPLWGLRGSAAFAGGWSGGSSAASDDSGLLTHTVEPLDLRITAVASGTLESASNSPVHSEVQGQVAVIRAVSEGTHVEKGEVVVELDSSELRSALTNQQIVVEHAINEHSQAVQAKTVAASTAESDTASAELALEFARLDVRKYEQGDFPVQRRTHQIDIALAEEELERARRQLTFSEDLAKDRYITEDELEADRFRAKQAEFKLENARDNARLLEEYTFPRTMRELEAKVADAERNLERVKSLAAVTDLQAETNLKARERTLELERTKLANLEKQLEACTLRAPQAGVVVYPVPPDEDQVELFIRPGNVVREAQLVFSIPDTDVLQVGTSLHEAIIDQIKPGMPARVWIEVYRDLELTGEVLKVSPLPQPQDWRRTTVKFYDTTVKLTEPAEGLRPGMSAKVEILVDRLPGVLALPVQSVVQKGHTGLCYVLENGAPKLRRVRLGKSNSEYVAVLEGLSAGERVVLAPDVLGFPSAELEQAQEFRWDREKVADAATATGTPEAR